jgi:hypothetical protein
MPTGLTGAWSSVKPGQLSLHFFVQLVTAIIWIPQKYSLDFYYALASRCRIGLVISTVYWTWRLNGELN